MSRFVDKECIVYRNEDVLGEYNRPIHSLIEVGRYKCDFKKRKIDVIRLSPQFENSENYVFYLPTNADIKANDYIVVGGIKYKASNPMKYRTHLEIEVVLEGEI